MQKILTHNGRCWHADIRVWLAFSAAVLFCMTGAATAATFKTVNGEVVIESDQYTRLGGSQGGTWFVNTEKTGFNGSGYMESSKDDPKSTTFISDIIRMEYDIDFKTAGTYYIHLRTFAVDATENGFFASINGVQVDYGDAATDYIYVKKRSRWWWYTDGGGAEARGFKVSFTVATPGIKTFIIHRRDKGSRVDRIWLTQNQSNPQDVATLNLPNPLNFIVLDVDNDGDGYTAGQGDCDDGNAAVNPGATEICDDGIDNDCDTLTDCADGDCAATCGGGSGAYGFDTDSDGFAYGDDPFRNTNHPPYASGSYESAGGISGGGISVALGGLDSVKILDGMSGGWSKSFTVAGTDPVTISLKYRLMIAGEYESDEYSQVLVAVDGNLVGTGGNDYLAQLTGTDTNTPQQDTDWQTATLQLNLSEGSHVLTVGAWNNQKTGTLEATKAYFDDIAISQSASSTDADGDGYTIGQGDCDDGNAAVNPGATEICGDGIDQDCDGQDLACGADIDDDGDGYTENQGDCDDGNAAVNPGATEICDDGIDNDCDTLTDCADGDCTATCGGGSGAYGFDTDSDGFAYGDDPFRNTNHPPYASGSYESAGGISGGGGISVTVGGLDSVKILDGMSGGWSKSFTVVGTDPVTISLKYRLMIAGEYESNEYSQVLVAVDGNLVGTGGNDYLAQLTGTDTNTPQQDTGWQTATLQLNLSEGSHVLTVGAWNNQKTGTLEATKAYFDDIAVSQSAPSTDADGDGYTIGEGDCDDGNAAVNPGAAEICGDGIDQDCDGQDLACGGDIDDDGDGYTENQGDCDDGNAAVNPGAAEICGDGIDQDCNGQDLLCGGDIDDDGDDYTENQGDCDDGNAAVNPGAAEICGDGIDNDCDGLMDCSDVDCSADCGGVVESYGFDADSEGFLYGDDLFRNTGNPAYASGRYESAGGNAGGGLSVTVGGIDKVNVFGMSGGWSKSFSVTGTDPVFISLKYRLIVSGEYEADEYSQVLLAVDENLVGTGGNDYLIELRGTNDSTPDHDSEWQTVTLQVDLSQGVHTIAFGAWNNKKTGTLEVTRAFFDDVVISNADSQQLLLVEDFSTGDVSDWTVVDESTLHPSDWRVVNGKYSQLASRVDEWEQNFHLGSYTYYKLGSGFTDYQVRLKVTSLASAFGPRDSLGILFRYQDENNYYRLLVSRMQGIRRLEKKTNGQFEILSFDGRGFTVGQEFEIILLVSGSKIFIYMNGQALFTAQDTDHASGTIGLFTQGPTSFDDIIISLPSESPRVALFSPNSYSVGSTDSLPMPYELNSEAVTLNMPSGGGVRFVKDGGGTPGDICYDHIAPYLTDGCLFNDISSGDHSIEATLVNSADQPIEDSAGFDIDQNLMVAYGAKYFLAVGDSITNGFGDDDTTDNDSSDGRLLSRGMTPLLSNHLSDAFSKTVVVYNEGLGGTTSAQGLERIPPTMNAHPQSQVVLLLFGSNDPSGTFPTMSGKGCTAEDYDLANGECLNTFKHNMYRMITAIQLEDKVPAVAKVPFARNVPVFWDDLLQEYNDCIDELYLESGLVIVPPDFYNSFKQDASLYFDDIHPNGKGYKLMGTMWRDVIVPSPAF